MIFEGIKLMVVGMTTVMLFLFLMIFFINLVSKLTRQEAAKELKALEEERKALIESRKRSKQAQLDDADEDIAVITAAIAAYEAERFARA